MTRLLVARHEWRVSSFWALWFGPAASVVVGSKRRRIHSPARTVASDFEGHEVWVVDIHDCVLCVRWQFSLSIFGSGLCTSRRCVGENLFGPAAAEGFDELNGGDQPLSSQL